MANTHDNRCTPRRDDWKDLCRAIRAFPHGRIGHEIKNVLREEWRRLTGKCQDKDEHEP